MHEWQFNIRGKRVEITAVLAPNGKVIIRANGRVVTTPIGEQERERWFAAEGAQFHLQRAADGLRLQEVPIAVAAPPQVEQRPAITPQPETVQRRILLFALAGTVQLIVCILLRLLFGLEMARLEAEIEQIASRTDVRVSKVGLENAAATIDATKRTFTLEALVGLAMVAGAALLLLRVRWAPAALYFTSWGIVAVALLGIVEADFRAHRQMAFAFNQAEAARFLRGVHGTGLVLLILAAIASGVLLSLLNRRALEVEIQGAAM